MGLHEDLKALLPLMPEDDQKAFTALMEKHPKLSDGWLRQSDYDRFMNKAKDEIKAANEKAQGWIDWAALNKPKHEKLVAEWPKLEKERDELRARVDEQLATIAKLNSGEGDDVKAEQVNAIVQEKAQALLAEKGFVTKADIDKMVSDTIKTTVDPLIAAERDKFLKETFPQTTAFTMDAVDVQFQHWKEFGELLPRQEISDFMQKNNILSPKDGYERWIAPKRTEREIAKKVDEGVKAEMAKRNMPGVSSPGSSDMGPLQIKLANADPLAGKTVELGDNQAAMAAAAEIRSEGKG